MTQAQRKRKLIDSKTPFWSKWLPWRYALRKLAHKSGFLDPLSILGRLERFAQPSEVASPIELLRAGMVFHARGLINTKAIQHNLDWIWPYWVEQQFDPASSSFVPRAFSVSHINLTHRNWTCVGFPGCQALPIVDPRGLVTPYFDGWSLDAWVLTDRGQMLAPSRLPAVQQDVDWSAGVIAVTTDAEADGLRLAARVWAEPEESDGAACCIRWTASAPESAWLVLALRPANPEGVSFIHAIGTDETGTDWQIDAEGRFGLDRAPDRHLFCRYHDGDVVHLLPRGSEATQIEDDVGLATAAILYRLQPDTPLTVNARVDLRGDPQCRPLFPAVARGAAPEPARIGPDAAGRCRMQHPDPAWTRLYDIHRHNLLLHSPFEVYPGPFTYKRFWFRDAAYILHAMLAIGMHDRVRRLLDDFPARQTRTGYYRSQEGEWDSNGQVLWLLHRYCTLTGEAVPAAWRDSIVRGARWIHDKREHSPGALHDGLMPAGFSAEHLGTNDYYYWDDFWSVAGLSAAADLADSWGDSASAQRCRDDVRRLHDAIETSRQRTESRRSHQGFPASPYRRMDAGAIGSIVCGYPLQLYPPDDPRVLDTVDFLMQHCFHGGGFFQDMIHSGINAYLSLHVAQVLLRAGDARAYPIITRIAELASPTGNWPEAIHPNTLGGCMGDGQHIWAAADWILMMRALYLREEGDTLVLAPGLPSAQIQAAATDLSFGPTPTPWGDVSVTVSPTRAGVLVRWSTTWRRPPRAVRIAIPGLAAVSADPAAGQATVSLTADAATSP